MTGSLRLLSWLGAGMIIMAGAPAAQAAASAGPQPRAAGCGSTAEDFNGGFRDGQYHEIGYLFNVTDQNTVTVFYRGTAIEQGPASANAGVLTWTVDGVTYTSTSIDCTDLLQPNQVTLVQASSNESTDTVELTRPGDL